MLDPTTWLALLEMPHASTNEACALMYGSPKPNHHLVWAEAREILWLTSTVVLLSIGEWALAQFWRWSGMVCRRKAAWRSRAVGWVRVGALGLHAGQIRAQRDHGLNRGRSAAQTRPIAIGG